MGKRRRKTRRRCEKHRHHFQEEKEEKDEEGRRGVKVGERRKGKGEETVKEDNEGGGQL